MVGINWLVGYWEFVSQAVGYGDTNREADTGPIYSVPQSYVKQRKSLT